MLSLSHTAPLRVLLVEDSLFSQKLLVGLLDLWNCAVTVATNGQQAVDRMAVEEFDVVLMDIQMPVMDGLTATRSFSASSRSMSPPDWLISLASGDITERCVL